MKNINEFGRSMIEMLGVLAIIGVLSIGGIVGYTQAMRRHRANEIMYAIVSLAATAKTRTSQTLLQYIDAFPDAQPITGLLDFRGDAGKTSGGHFVAVHSLLGDGSVMVYAFFSSREDCAAVESMVKGSSALELGSRNCDSASPLLAVRFP